jgi:hypothetical protein
MHRVTHRGQTGVTRDGQDRRRRYAEHPLPVQKRLEARPRFRAEAIGEGDRVGGCLPITGESAGDFG